MFLYGGGAKHAGSDWLGFEGEDGGNSSLGCVSQRRAARKSRFLLPVPGQLPGKACGFGSLSRWNWRILSVKRAGPEEVEASVEPDQTFEVSEQEVLETKRENVKSILQAYRFTGLSGKLTSRGVCVSISTAFEGNLLDSYFVDIVIQKPLRIHHHSIPVFIPLEEISAKYLQTNIQHFLFSLCEYLNAYSGRKYQADRLQRDFAAFLAGPLQRNSLCNLLSFTYKAERSGQSFPFCARLLYKDITRTLPTDVTVTYQGMDALSTSWEEQRASHENLFCTKSLHQVFASFARREEKLDMNLVY